jgi:regulator of protease activity HflC (stomatin/prohibitin superfamily)
MPVTGVLEYLWFRDNDPWWATLLRAVTLIALGVLFAFKGMHKVPSGSKALRTRFKKVLHYRRDIYDRLGYKVHRRGEARVVGPGLVIGIPFVHNVMIESVTEQFKPLPPMIRLQPRREVVSQVNFQVVDLEKALVGVTKYKRLLVNDCAEVLSNLIKQADLRDDEISAHVLAHVPLQQRASELGVKLLKLTVSTSNPTEEAQSASPAFKQEGIVNGAPSPAAVTVVGNNAPAA